MIVLLSLVLTLTIFLPDLIADATPPPPKQGCTDKLVSFSPCLGYVSAPPNDVTETADPRCCDAFWKALEQGVSNCLCYLIQEPLIFGFPLNLSRVATLASACVPPSNATSANNSSGSLCSVGWQALPPLQGITAGSVIPKPFNSGPHNVNSPEFVDTPPWSFGSPPAPNISQTQAGNLSESGHISSWNSWFPPAIIVSFVVIFC